MFDDPLDLLPEKEGNGICTSQHRRFGCIKKYTLIPGEVGVIQLDHVDQVDPAGQNVLVDPRQVVVAQVHLLQARLLGHQSAEQDYDCLYIDSYAYCIEMYLIFQ